MAEPPTIVYVVTSSLSYALLKGQLQYMHDSGFRTVLVTGSPVDGGRRSDRDVEFVTVPMTRGISPLSDLLALVRLWRLFRRVRPHITNVSTPKAGLLAGLAAVLARVPCRVYVLRGLRFETERGWKRRLLIATEFVACRCAHRVIAVSNGVQEVALRHRVAAARKIIVLGHGSSNGIDVQHFNPPNTGAQVALDLRQSLGIPREAPVVGFVGRFTRDKGLPELLDAYDRLKRDCPELRLLLVGDFEGGPGAADMRTRAVADRQIVCTGFVADTAPYYALMDVLALPTHREGFPNTVLEAQAAAMPVVTTFATGAVDSIDGGRTGLLVPPGDTDALTAALRRLLCDSKLRASMGQAGRARVMELFRQEGVWTGYVAQYRAILSQRSCGRGPRKYCQQAAKRALDLAASLIGLFVLSPLMLVLAALIWLVMGPPILFRQTRAGYRGRPFTLLKFRTMRQATDAEGRPLADADRLTTLGKQIRKLSLDELPQLWNVLRGDMSLVGPRPLLMEYLPRYTPEQARRHEMKPGITGLAQINGRNGLSWEDKFRLDLEYVDHWSLWLDLRIPFRTFFVVLTRRGITAADHVTAPKFTGANAPEAGNV